MRKIWILLLVGISLNACQPEKKNSSKATIQPKTGNVVHVLTRTLPAEAPFLFNNGEKIILNYTERSPHDASENKLKWTFFNEKTGKLDTFREIPVAEGLQLHYEGMAKVGVDKKGNLLAVFRKKLPTDRSRFGGQLYYTVSYDEGKTWSEAKQLVTDTSSNSQAFYDLALLPTGRFGLTWLDSRSKRRGKTLYFASTDENYEFNYQKPIAFSTCECCRTELYVDPEGVIHVAYRNLVEPDEPGFDGNGDVEIRDMYYLFSKDTGKTFSQPVPIHRDNWHVFGCPHTGPSLAGSFQMLAAVWFTGKLQAEGIYFIFKGKDGFSDPILLDKQGRHPQMIGINNKFYVVYDSYYEENEKGYYRIILDVIDKQANIKRYEVSRPYSQNNHPVVTPIGRDKILIVWVNEDTRTPKLEYKVININEIDEKEINIFPKSSLEIMKK